MCGNQVAKSGTVKGKIKVYVNGIRIIHNTLETKFIPFQIKYFQEERSHSLSWNFSKVMHLPTHNID